MNPSARRDSVDEFMGRVDEMFPFIDLETEEAVDRIHKLAKYFGRQTDVTAERFGLKRGEFKVLVKLRTASDMSMSPGDLAQRLVLSTGAMTNRLDRLEATGLVTRNPDPDDRRALIVTLTDEGTDLIDRAVKAQAAEEHQILSALEPDERHRLNGLLRRLMLAFEDDRRPS
jgi:DNA-binding MarR family transcriptional regulator